MERRLRRADWALAALMVTALGGAMATPGCGGDDTTSAPQADAGTTSGDSGGGATCAAPSTQCGGACVDTRNDPQNCGTCGNACPAGLACSAGACALACAGGSTSAATPASAPTST